MPTNFGSRLNELTQKPSFIYGSLAAITLLAAVLRFYKLGEWSFWVDELYTVGRVQAHYNSFETLLRNIPPTRNWVPLSLILTGNVFHVLGISEWSARLVPAIIGIISIPLLFFPIKWVFGPGVGLIESLLLAVSPWHLYWSQNARGYTSLMLFYSLALFAFFFGLERDRIHYFLFFIVFFYLAISERLVGLLIVPVILIYLILLRFSPIKTPPGFRIRNVLLIIIPLILMILYEVFNFTLRGQSILYGIAAELITTFVGNSIENPFTQATLIFLSIGTGLVTIAFFSGLYLVFEKNRAGLLIFLGAVVPFTLVILLTPFTFTEERYAFVTLPCWLILAAVAVKELNVRTKGYEKLLVLGVLFLLLAEAGAANLMYYRVNNGNRRDWRGAFHSVQEKMEEDDIIISTWPQLADFYIGQEAISWQDTNADFVKSSGKRVWFVIVPDMAWAWGSEDFLWWVEMNTELIDVRYLRLPDNTNLYTYLYDPERHTNSEFQSK